jgi:hypothetical protein
MSADVARLRCVTMVELQKENLIMEAKYVVSIAGTLLYFDENRQPAPEFPHDAASESEKPAVKLIPTEEKPAAQADWNEALADFSSEQRNAAEISVVQSKG